MSRILSKQFILLSLAMSCGSNIGPVWALAPFTARVEKRTNIVNVKPKNQEIRSAKVADILNTQDSLLTGERSRAELIFQDGSLARIGSNAIFTISSDTRSIQLENGLILLHVPPGLGGARIQGRSAVAAIKGDTVLFQEGIIPNKDPRQTAKTFTKVIALSQEPDEPKGSISVTYKDPDKGTTQEVTLTFGQMFLLTQEGVKIATINVSNLMDTSSILSLSKDSVKSSFENQLTSAFQAEVMSKAEEQKMQISQSNLQVSEKVVVSAPEANNISPETVQLQASTDPLLVQNLDSTLRINLLSSNSQGSSNNSGNNNQTVNNNQNNPNKSGGASGNNTNTIPLLNKVWGNNATYNTNKVILSTAQGMLGFEPSSSFFQSTINFPMGINPTLSFDYSFTVNKFNPVQLNDQFLVDIKNSLGTTSNLLTIRKITDLPFILDSITGQYTATSGFNQDISSIISPGESADLTFTVKDRPSADPSKDASVTITNIQINGQPAGLLP
jgi:hypothetical protein